MALNHAHLQNILNTMENKLKLIGTPPTPVKISCTGWRLWKLSLHPHKRTKKTYNVGEVLRTDVRSYMSTVGRSGENIFSLLRTWVLDKFWISDCVQSAEARVYREIGTIREWKDRLYTEDYLFWKWDRIYKHSRKISHAYSWRWATHHDSL